MMKLKKIEAETNALAGPATQWSNTNKTKAVARSAGMLNAGKWPMRPLRFIT